jgi:hypothetical protein
MSAASCTQRYSDAGQGHLIVTCCCSWKQFQKLDLPRSRADVALHQILNLAMPNSAAGAASHQIALPSLARYLIFK